MAAVLAGEGRFAGDLASEFGISLHTHVFVWVEHKSNGVKYNLVWVHSLNAMPKKIDKAELESENEVELYDELMRYAQESQEVGYHALEIHNAMRNVAVEMTNQFKRGAHKVGDAEVEKASDD
jgi:hypothetical protein